MTYQGKKIRVGIIFGGQSGEHEISLASAASVIQALNKQRYDIIPIGISKEGIWLNPHNSFQMLLDHNVLESEEISYDSHSNINLESPVTLFRSEGGNPSPVDVIVPMLHGTFGEDGTVQGLLELVDVPYVGACVMASAVSMDKGTMKILFRAHGLPVCDFLIIMRKQWQAQRDAKIEEISSKIGFPLFVKPTNLGSSIGISKITSPDKLPEAIDLACEYDRKIIVEKGINAREIECSILGNENPIVSLPGEIIPKGDFYDYECKYTEGLMELKVPAPLSPEQIKKVQEIALKGFLAVDAAGMARMDLFIDKDTGTIYLNEINTIPGFTSTSVYSMLFAASGISYSELLDRLIELAFDRYRDKKSSKTTYL